jgi:hypothetical protein
MIMTPKLLISLLMLRTPNLPISLLLLRTANLPISLLLLRTITVKMLLHKPSDHSSIFVIDFTFEYLLRSIKISPSSSKPSTFFGLSILLTKFL